MIKTTADLIATIESNNNPYALRFEPSVYARERMRGGGRILTAIATFNHCSDETAQMICATSWGAFQIMGFNLYSDQKFTASIIAYCTNSALQLESFKKFISAHGINYTLTQLRVHDNAMRFGAIYNGDAIAYANEIESALA